MFYTAQAWLDKQPEAEQAAAAARLAPCVRCLQLSSLWLSALAMADNAAGAVMQTHLPHIKQYYGLQLLGSLTPEQVAVKCPELQDNCPSWFLPLRQYTPLPAGCVELQWSLPVSQLRACCRRALSSGAAHLQLLESASSTAPLKGVSWTLQLLSTLDAAGSLSLDLGVCPRNLPSNSWIVFS